MEAAIILGVVLLVGIVIYSLNSGSSSSVTPKLPAKELEQFHNEMVERVSSGELASHFTSNLLLMKGERLILEIPGIQLCEERAGSSGQRLIGKPEVALIDVGEFTLTNRRFTFAGAKRSVECSISKIISMRAIHGGLVVARRGKTKTEYYMGPERLSLWITPTDDDGKELKERKVEWKLTGDELKGIIQRLLQEEKT